MAAALAPRPTHPPNAIGVVVLCRKPDAADAVNRLLRRAGIRSQCLHVASGSDLESLLESQHPELVFIAADDRLFPIESIAGLRARREPPPSVIVLLEECTDAASESALVAGAQDIASLLAPRRLVLVAQREIAAQRNTRALIASAAASADYRRALDVLREGSTDAIAEVVEGIVIDANPAWLNMLGYTELGSIDGLPLMDCFDPLSHAALKGALSACLHGHWPAEPLRLRALHADGSARPIDIELSLGAAADGEAVITLRVPAVAGDDSGDLREQLARAIRTDHTTGFLHRAHLIDTLVERCSQPITGGVRYLCAVQIDHPEQVADRVGPLAAEGLIAMLADELRCHLTPNDLAGRFTGSSFILLMERGTSADLERWAAHIIGAVREHAFVVAGREVRISLTIGLARVIGTDTDGAMTRAMEAIRLSRNEGGDRLMIRDPEPRAGLADDRHWAQRLKAALMDNRFRLQQQPIANLHGGAADCFDLLIRLQGEDGADILPSEFLAAAQRNDLMRALDRWALGACVALAAQRSGKGFFVRISADSLADQTVVPWLKTQLATAGVDPSRIVIQVPEAEIDRHPDAAEILRTELRKANMRFAVEHYGFGRDPIHLAAHLKPDFVKIDGKLMQGLAQQHELQASVRTLVAHAKSAGARTIAERVEDANTMAVLFALGVESIQGRFVQKSEAVVLG